MTLFFAHEIKQQQLLFTEEERHHAVKTLRYREGDSIYATDGKGTLWEAIITTVKSNDFSATISKILKKEEVAPRLKLYIALPKNPERFEWFLEKSTEIGIGTIVPIITHRSEKFFSKKERWTKILVSAMKQSGRLFLPNLQPEQKFNACLSINHGNAFIAHCLDNIPKTPLQSVSNTSVDTSIFIGPEGDFTSDEIQEALKNKFTSISLGNARLRTETAGVVACTLWNFTHQ